MKFFKTARRLPILIGLLASLLTSPVAQQPRPPQTDEVVRVNTDLVQTAITVLDKNGRFVEGLDRSQFELTIDGKPRAISFFERVTAGSAREAQLMGGGIVNPTPNPTAVRPVARGRNIVFFIDDLHLEPDSLHRTRQMLHHFLDTQMASGDSVAIASASGQVGFLQQFTNNKRVLTAAIERLAPLPYEVRGFGTGSTKMTEYMALDIDTGKSDSRKVLDFYVEECMKQSMTIKKAAFLVKAIRATCETEVKSSARAVLMQAGTITQNMYASLDSLLRSTGRMPGRKLAFFVSDGFLMDTGPHGPGLRDKLDRIIDSAQRSGVVIYTIHAKGLYSNFPDASNKRPIDGQARLDMAMVGEIAATQDALHALADETGGRALRNQNYFDLWVDKVLDETSNYYLVAWRPDSEDEKTAKLRNVKISITGRPELVVRAPRGYIPGPQPETSVAAERTGGNKPAVTPEAALRDALADAFPSNSLPTLLSLTYLNTPKNETVLTSSIQIANGGLNFGEDGKQPAIIKLAGVVLNDKGKIAATFKNQLNINPLDGQSNGGGVIYNHHTPMTPGVYQVRVAARDEKSGRVGNAMQWVVIPDLASHQLTLSSVLLGGQVIENTAAKDSSAQVQLSVDRRFTRSGNLGYWIFVYNARRNGGGTPNLTVQTKVLRNGQLVVAAPQRAILNANPDPERIPFGEQLSLNTLTPGRYDLQVTITDTIAGTSATQSVDFEVL